MGMRFGVIAATATRAESLAELNRHAGELVPDYELDSPFDALDEGRAGWELCAVTSVASRPMTTWLTVRPATCEPGRSVPVSSPRPHSACRNAASTAASTASSSRHAVAVDATGPCSNAWLDNPRRSLITSPPSVTGSCPTPHTRQRSNTRWSARSLRVA
jgi:hypothetical protein